MVVSAESCAACRADDFGLGIFKRVPGARRVPFFRFSLMVIRENKRHRTARQGDGRLWAVKP